MTPEKLAQIRDRADKATPGPWRWYGNTDTRYVTLSTRRFGRLTVMSFDRYGMNGAQPVFAEGRTWKPNPEGMADFGSCGYLVKASEMPVFEVAPQATNRKDPRVYRADVCGFHNPDAEFIAHSRQDVDDLLAEVDRLSSVMQAAASTAMELGAGAGMDVIIGYLSDAGMLPRDLLDGGETP